MCDASRILQQGRAIHYWFAILFLRSESDHIKTCCQTHHLLFPCCPFIGSRINYKLISYEPLSKQMTALCKLKSSDGLLETSLC